MPADTPEACGVQVSCRVRASPSSIGNGSSDALLVDASTSCIRILPSHSFAFDHVLPPSATQSEVFDAVGLPCVRDLLVGYNCTILAYGQTGSGKTHTTVGDVDSTTNRGLIPRIFEQLFSSIDTDDAQLAVSCIEVYQERVRDLLRPRAQTNLRIREDPRGGGVWVDGATEVNVRDAATATAVLHRGLVHRAVGATRMNQESSRSHAVFAITLTRRSTSTRGRLCIVDLAGSEQAKKSLATATRLDEAKHINRSLSALGNVIHALTTPAVYVPYRDSKLTRLLQSSLGGNAKTHLLLTCTVDAEHTEESLATLRFGARAKRMRNQPMINSDAGGGTSGEELLVTLENKVRSLCAYIRELEESNKCQHCSSQSASAASILESESEELVAPENETDANADTNEFVAPTLESNQPLSVDLVMQSEISTLKRALDELRHERAHAHTLAQSLVTVEAVEKDRLLRLQAASIERLEQENEALQRQLQAQDEQLRQHIQRSELVAQRERESHDAESEILRRRVDTVERQCKVLQLELAASQSEQRELKNVVAARQRELQKAEEESNVLRRRIAEAEREEELVVETPTLPVQVMAKPIQLRPVTVGSGSSSLAIQSWWAGNNSGGDDGSAGEQQLQAVSPPPRRTKGRTKCTGWGDPSPHEAAEDTGQLHTSGGARPFRARLVGLLSSLEQETSSYKELLEGDPLAIPRPTRGGRRRPPLPQLSESIPQS